jgi:nitroimidazol reductase NimA-like FMN-containing flavoprotein (pyridoxamine 5'-phosphate oxidase superfamily)
VRLVDDHSGIEVIPRDECLRLLGDEVVGRVGFVAGGAPEVLPVNYVLDGDSVVFRTAAGTKLDGVMRSPVVFEVDRVDRDRRSGWSVVVHGVAHEVTTLDQPALRERLAGLPLEPWVPGDKAHVVRIVARSITGRRVG